MHLILTAIDALIGAPPTKRVQISAREELPRPLAGNPHTSLRDVERFLKDVLKDVGKRGTFPERRFVKDNNYR